MTSELSSFVQANEALRVQLDRRARVDEIRTVNEHKIMESGAYVHRSRSPIRGPVPHPLEPVVGLHRVPVFDERIVETRVPVVERVERTIEHIPVGRDPRSRSPLLGRTYGVSGVDGPRFSAATPTVAHRTSDGK